MTQIYARYHAFQQFLSCAVAYSQICDLVELNKALGIPILSTTHEWSDRTIAVSVWPRSWYVRAYLKLGCPSIDRALSLPTLEPLIWGYVFTKSSHRSFKRVANFTCSDLVGQTAPTLHFIKAIRAARQSDCRILSYC